MLLAEIEKRTEQPIAGLFDLVAGTSTGGIIALGLTIPRCPGAPLYSAQRFVELYEHEGARIFHRSLLRAMFAVDNLTWKKYSSSGVEQVLEEYFGDSRLRDAATDVVITSYEIERRFPFFFKSRSARKRPDYDFLARDVARATSAAPTYLRAYETIQRNEFGILYAHRRRGVRQQPGCVRAGGGARHAGWFRLSGGIAWNRFDDAQPAFESVPSTGVWRAGPSRCWILFLTASAARWIISSTNSYRRLPAGYSAITGFKWRWMAVTRSITPVPRTSPR